MNKKILLIEDNDDIRETTAAILELAQYDVLLAADGKEGVAIALKEKPDLVISDIMMPGLDGYGVLHLLSKNEATACIPFIFLTAKAERSDYRKGMDMGADDYIMKPFDDIELLNAVESRLKKTDLLKKEFTGSIEGLNELLGDAGGFDGLKQLSIEKDLRHFRKKDIIYAEGGSPKGIFFLQRGKIKTFRTNEQGKELITGLYKEGDFFGYLALIKESAYQDTAMALEDCEIGTIPKDDFFSLIHRNAQVSAKFLQMIAGNVHEKEEQLVRLAYNSVRKRVAEALIKISDHYAATANPVADRSISVSREDLANLAGTATETTIRTLADFRQEGLIEIKSGSITLLQYDQLSGMKN